MQAQSSLVTDGLLLALLRCLRRTASLRRVRLAGRQIGLSLGRRRLGIGRVDLRLLLEPSGVVGRGLRFYLGINRGLPLTRKAILGYLLDRNLTRILGRLHSIARSRNQRLPVTVASGGIRIGRVHQLHGVLIACAGIGLRAFRLRDAQRIASLVIFQGKICADYNWIKLVASGNIAAPLQQFIRCVYGFGTSLGVGGYDVLQNHDVTWLPHSVVWLCGNNQRERLKVGGCSQLAAIIVANQHFAQVHGAALGRDRPQNISQILAAIGGWTLQISKLRFHLDGSALAPHFDSAIG